MIVVNSDNSNLTEAYYSGTSLTEIYMGEHLIWPTGGEPSKKVQLLNKSNMQWGDAPCNSSSTLTRDDIYIAWQNTQGQSTQNNDLIKVVIGDCVTVLGDNLFSEDLYLSAVTIPNTVTEIGYNVFKRTQMLTSITLPPNLVSIGEASFSNSGINNIVFPNTLQTIGRLAFKDCKLTSVTIPSNVTSIGESAFYQFLEAGETNPIQYVMCYPVTPPTLGRVAFTDSQQISDYPIYVPAASVDAYKAATNWSTYADRIQAIP